MQHQRVSWHDEGLIQRCVCGAREGFAYFKRNGLDFARCRCGMAHLLTLESAESYVGQYLGEYHAAGDRHPGCVPYTERYEHDFKIAGLRWRRYRALLERAHEIETALDVGCATGAFVDYLRSIGVQALGVDPDPAMAREFIATGTSATVEQNFGGFDLVTYHDVLEHVLDPVGELGRARELVKPHTGVLVVDVPDVWCDAGQHHFKAEHPWYFTEDVLLRLLRQAAFTPLFVDRPVPGKLVVYGETAPYT